MAGGQGGASADRCREEEVPFKALFPPHFSYRRHQQGTPSYEDRLVRAGDPAQYRQHRGLCASTGIHLNLIEPLGFKLEDRYLKRAGLDYWPHVCMDVWPDWDSWLAAATAENGGTPPRCVLTSARGGEPLQHFAFAPDDCLVFGPETRGLPPEILKRSPYKVRIPMLKDSVRSINLSTAAGIVLFTAMSSCGLMEGPEWQ